MGELRGWEHDCGYHTDSESLFMDHIEKCEVTFSNTPIYREVLDTHGHMSEQIDD